MIKQEKRNSKILNIIKEHIRKNTKEYMSLFIIFLIGIIIGVIFINYTDEVYKTQIKDYLIHFSESLNTDYKIDTTELLKSSITNNLILAVCLWFIGSTIIGIPIVYLIVGIKGFSLGYTISSIMVTYPFWKGILFTLLSLFIQNLIFIPCLLALGVSGIKLYKSIIKDKRRDNIKLEILRHTIFFAFITIFLVLSSFLEVYISSKMISLFIKSFVT